MYKVYGRQVYCETLTGWVREMIWIHVIRRVFAKDIEAISCKCGIQPK